MKNKTSLRIGLLIAVGCAILLAGFGALEVVSRHGQGGETAKFIASFACFGFLIGSIMAFDPSHDQKTQARPLLRISLGCLSGGCLGLLWQWPVEGLALSIMVAGTLGYAGMTWLKYL